MKSLNYRFILCVFCVVAHAVCAYEIEVEGLQWRQEGQLERLLKDVLLKDAKTFDGTQAEDAVLILRSELNRKGFLSPKIEYELFFDEEKLASGEWPVGFEPEVLPWSASDRVVFFVSRGERAFFETIKIDGLSTLSLDEAKAFFAAPIGLFISESSRAYSPAALDSGIASLRRRLVQAGRPEAVVTIVGQPLITPTGEVSIHLEVDEGPAYRWGEIAITGSSDKVDVSNFLELNRVQKESRFNEEALEDWIVLVRNAHLEIGYADVQIQAEKVFELALDGTNVQVAVALNVTLGPRIQMGEVRYVGLEQTLPSFLDRIIPLEEGKWLNVLQVQEARDTLSQMGIFREVSVQEAQSEVHPEPKRDLVFKLEERDRYEVSVLFGYGSYEKLRVGAEARVLNLLGRAHSAQVRVRQSFRSSAGILLYNIPRPIAGVDLFQARLQGLRREERAFDRQEALLAFGLQRGFFGNILQASAEYRFELLRSIDLVSEELVGDTRANVGSLLFEASWDTRDRAVYPTNGQSVQTQLELASPFFGSEAYFQRWILRSTFHRSFNHQRLRWHMGLEGGFLSRLGAEAADLPVNKRFFLGGENSVRGYQDGEASPQDDLGELIGAEMYVLGHIEFEMLLFESISAVAFVDGLWASPYLDQVDDGELLGSAGIGIRYATPLGPIRLEYGYNLNRRTFDPLGTLHFSIGFPF